EDDRADLRHPGHVLQRVDGQPNVGAVLRPGGGEQLDEVDGAVDELLAVARVDRHRPVRVGASERQAAEGRGVVEDRVDVDLGGGELGVVEAVVPVAPEGALAVDLVVSGDDDVVEVEVDRDGVGVHGSSLPCARSLGSAAGAQDDSSTGRCRSAPRISSAIARGAKARPGSRSAAYSRPQYAVSGRPATMKTVM